MGVPKSFSKSDMQAWGASEAQSDFANDKKKCKHATEALNVGIDFIHKMPIGWNINSNEETFRIRAEKYINANYNPKPSGFLPAIGIGWLFWQMVSAVIMWAVQKLLNAYYPKNEQN